MGGLYIRQGRALCIFWAGKKDKKTSSEAGEPISLKTISDAPFVSSKTERRSKRIARSETKISLIFSVSGMYIIYRVKVPNTLYSRQY